MAEPEFHRFHLPLNPTAQEFRPTYIYYTFPPPPMFIIPAPFPIPTRALLLTSVPTNVSESILRRELELFGDVRAVQMERLVDGIVTIHFYDLRRAINAVNEIQYQYMQQQLRLRRHFGGVTFLSFSTPPPSPTPARGLVSGKAVWAQFTFPIVAGIPDRYNQGTVTVTVTSGSDVSIAAIRDVFEAFGDVKEITGTPLTKTQKFVEFYDTRDASKAVAAVNGGEIDGKPVVVEFSRPGGHKCYPAVTEVLVQPPPTALYHRPSPPCRKDRAVECDGGVKKNAKHRQQSPPEQWVGGGGRSKQWKGSRYSYRKCDPRFLIKDIDDENVMSSFQDSRTTVMIKNIPNKYSQKLLLNLLDNHCIQCNEGDDNQPLSAYDFVYLPIDFVNKCNVGYGFVNMTSPEATQRLYKAFHHQNWEVFNSKKICQLSYARLQGLEALKQHFKKSKFPGEAENYMPVTFTPPRDGQTITEPTPIIGCTATITSSSSSSSETGHHHHDLTDRSSSSDLNINGNLAEEDTQSNATGLTSSVSAGEETFD